MFLLNSSKAPDHATFARFKSIHFALCAEKISVEVTNFSYEIGELLGESIFIDGTRNSYSKTDINATFICMEEDAIKNR